MFGADWAGRRAGRPAWITQPLVASTIAGVVLLCATLFFGECAIVRGATVQAGFLSTPTDQVGVPGMLAGGEITPEGDLYTGWAEYTLRFGSRLVRWNQPTRVLPRPGIPVMLSSLRDGNAVYTVRIFAVPVAGSPVAFETVTIANAGAHPQRARVALGIAYTAGRETRGVHGIQTGAYRYERPLQAPRLGLYEQPGQSFSSDFDYRVAGRDVERSGLLLARGPAAVSRALATSGGRGVADVHAAQLFQPVVPPHRDISLTWQIPLDPPLATHSADLALDSMPVARARDWLFSEWRQQEAGMMRVSVPEPKVVATYRAAVAEMLTSRFHTAAGWVQASNKLQYQAFWIRDAAMETQALDLLGLFKPAEQDLEFLKSFQEQSGLFISRPEQYDGLGQALWALGENARLTHNPEYAAAQLNPMAAAVRWLVGVSAADPLGLLPPGNPHDNELAYGHITGDNIWAAVGLRSAVATALLAGRSDLAATWERVDQRFEASLDTALRRAVARAGHIPPVLDTDGGQDWGNYYAAYPDQILPAASQPVRATVDWARAHFAQGLPTYDSGHSLHDYLGFSIFQTQLESGDTRGAVAGLYSELTHTTSTDNGWEFAVAPFRSRSPGADLSPHGTFAADYIALLRHLLVSEPLAGGVDLLAGASPAWLAPGHRVVVSDAPTAYGRISFTERAFIGSERLEWRAKLSSGTTLTWTLPRWTRRLRSSTGPIHGHTVTLTGQAGSVTVLFAGKRPTHSYALAAERLNSEYRRHKLPPPLVAARQG